MTKIDDAWRPFAKLHGFVRLVLLVDWDPIGIFGYTGAMDEYDGYATDICDLIRAGASRETLIHHLDTIEKQRMSSRGERPVQAEVADKLLRLYRTIQQDEALKRDAV